MTSIVLIYREINCKKIKIKTIQFIKKIYKHSVVFLVLIYIDIPEYCISAIYSFVESIFP